MEQTLLPKEKPKRKKSIYVVGGAVVAAGILYFLPIAEETKQQIMRGLLSIITGGF